MILADIEQVIVRFIDQALTALAAHFDQPFGRFGPGDRDTLYADAIGIRARNGVLAVESEAQAVLQSRMRKRLNDTDVRACLKLSRAMGCCHGADCSPPRFPRGPRTIRKLRTR